MNDVPATCPKCQGKMTQGHLVDLGYGGAELETWAEGSPKKAWIGGIKVPIMGRLPIATFRRNECGYLESFARKEFGAK